MFKLIMSVTVCVAIALPTSARSNPLLVVEMPKATSESPAAMKSGMAAYKRAQRYFRAGKNELALEEARNLFRALPRASSAYITAAILEDLGRPDEAFKMLLLAWSLKPVQAQRQDIEKAAVRIGKKANPPWAWVHYTAEPVGARVTIDGASAPMGRVFGVRGGAHEVRIVADGFDAQVLKVVFKAGPLMKTTFRLQKTALVPVAKVGTNPNLIAVGKTSEAPALAGPMLLGMGLAIAVGGGVMIWRSHEEGKEANRCRFPAAGGTEGTRLACYEDARDLSGALQVAGWIASGVGLAATLTGVVLMATEGDEEPGIVAGPGPTALGMSLGGRF